MYEVDFELHVDGGDLRGEVFMDFVDSRLYGKYQGDISPVVRGDQLYVVGSVEADDRNYIAAILPISNDLAGIGITVVGFKVVNTFEIA